MPNFKNAVPSSLRKQVESSRFAYELMARSERPEGQLLAGNESRSMAVKSRFARLPQEPEDAKITGTTRSLTRRLLALNLPKVNVKRLLPLITGKTA